MINITVTDRSGQDPIEDPPDMTAWWDSLDEVQRESVPLMVADCLRHLLGQDPQTWIPDSLRAQSGSLLDIGIQISFENIDQEVLKRRLEAEKELNT